MKLTEKDVAFLRKLNQLMQTDDLWVELKAGPPDYMVLRGNYGQKIARNFHMTRQGVRWRFQRLLNYVYVEAFETIIAVEQVLGASLRDHAVHVSRQRHELREDAMRDGFHSATTLDATQSNHDDRFHQDRVRPSQDSTD